MYTLVPFTQYAQSASLFTVEEARDLYAKDKHNRSILNLLHRLKTQGRVRLVANGVYAGALSAAPLNRYRVPHALGAAAPSHRLFQTERGADNILVTTRERSFVDCLLFPDYSGGVDELDKSLA